MSITVKELDKTLSLKLGDPVTDNGDGAIFHWDMRLKYLERAYGRILRTLPKLMRASTPLFAKGYKVTAKAFLPSTSGPTEEQKGNAIRISHDGDYVVIDDVKELYVITLVKGKAGYVKATHIDSDKYLSVKNKENAQYTPSMTSPYYAFLDNAIYLLPTTAGKPEEMYTGISLTYKQDAIKFTETTVVPIPNEYIDLLIVTAANEGMQDLARQDKVQLYSGDINNQLSILKGFADLQQSQQGSNLDG